MGQLFLVDDNVTQEELLKQVSHKFIQAAKNKKGRILGKKKVDIRRKVKTASVVSSAKRESKMDKESLLSSHYQACTLPTKPSQIEAGFRCVEEALKKMKNGDDEIPGNSREASLEKINRKRTADVIEDNSAMNCPKRERKDSCEILKDTLRSRYSESVAKSTTYTDSFETTEDVPSYNSEAYSEESLTSGDELTSPGCNVIYHKNRGQVKVGFNYLQEFISDNSDNKHSNTYTSCTVRPGFGQKKANTKLSNNVETVGVDCDRNVSSTSHFEVHICDNRNGTKKREGGFTESCGSSSESGVSESTSPSSEWILHDKDSSFCLKRIFNADGVSASAPVELNGVGCESDLVLSPPGADVRLPAVADIPDWMYVAVDCEMVGVGPKGKQSVLARCSIVDYEGSVLYDQYIKPSEIITDYRTPWSGIRPVHMKTAIPRDQALRDIRECLAYKIVIGHAVYHDFKVLGITPDHHFVRDTAQCHQLVEMAKLQGKGNGLKKLSEALLDRQIQVGRQGHCSVEDARATLDLFKLVRHSWEPTLYLKWSRKQVDIYNKVASFVAHATRQRDISSTDDFLNDIFWPSHVTN